MLAGTGREKQRKIILCRGLLQLRRAERGLPAVECEKAEKLIQAYVQNRLPEKEMEAFIEHVRNCPACYDELETYFIINHATRYLDNDEKQSYNLKGMLEEDLREKERTVRSKRKRNIFFSVLIFVLTVLLMLFTMHYLQIIELPWLKGLF